MTCEVALLNRRAVALAADSATTVTYWEKGEEKRRYFKGTNKLFNLSAVHPVGIMTSDSGNLHMVPWEVIVKAYRDHVGPKSHDHVTGYALDLFEYSRPLRRVIGLLPIEELAELAEILVSIESLKERVTTTTETVSGPIDVAVISKSDGFIWIKRKHYFKPELNPRYFTRKGLRHE